MNTDPSTRSGCSAHSRNAQNPPHDALTRTALSIPVASITASASEAKAASL
jgi:hypothetical protein